jgi:hypothetical protein
MTLCYHPTTPEMDWPASQGEDDIGLPKIYGVNERAVRSKKRPDHRVVTEIFIPMSQDATT